MPAMPLRAFSIGMMTDDVISSGEAPGSRSDTLTWAGSAFGKRSTPRSRNENTPSTTSDITSIVAKTGRRTQSSDSMAILPSTAIFIPSVSVSTSVTATRSARVQSGEDLHAVADAVAGLELARLQPIALDGERPVDAVAVLHGGVRDRHHLFDERGLEPHAGERARLQQRLGIRRQRFEGERARLRRHRGTDARHGGGERLVRKGIDAQRQRLPDLHPWRHAFGNLGAQLQRVHAHDGHDRHLRFHQLAEGDHPLLDIAGERRADGRVAQMALGELHRRRRGVDIGSEVLRLLQRGVIGGPLEPQRRVRVVEHLLRDELTLVQLGRALEALPGLRQFGGGSPHVGRVLDSRQLGRHRRHRTS